MTIKPTTRTLRNAMRTMLTVLMFAVLAVGSNSVLTSCHKRLAMTILEVEDSVRHYPSVVLGDDINIVYVLRNTGNDVLIITDIQPACPTIEPLKDNVTTIPPGEEAPMRFVFHADKNIGLARHSIRLFGNIAPKGEAELIFDTHVVRPSVDLSDYEEFHQKELQSMEDKYLNGVDAKKGYFTDDDYR